MEDHKSRPPTKEHGSQSKQQRQLLLAVYPKITRYEVMRLYSRNDLRCALIGSARSHEAAQRVTIIQKNARQHGDCKPRNDDAQEFTEVEISIIGLGEGGCDSGVVQQKHRCGKDACYDTIQ